MFLSVIVFLLVIEPFVCEKQKEKILGIKITGLDEENRLSKYFGLISMFFRQEKTKLLFWFPLRKKFL